MSTPTQRISSRESMRRSIAAEPERYRAQWRDTKRNNRGKHAEHRAARDKLNQAIQRGEIVKPCSCSICGATGRIEGHHEDYTKPYDVIWLCTLCHGMTRYASMDEIKRERGKDDGGNQVD